MPPEHQTMVKVLTTILYLMNNPVDHMLDQHWMRKFVLQHMRKLGWRGRQQVSLKVWHAVYWLLVILKRSPPDGGLIVAVCRSALRPPKLSTMSEQTWDEQIAGCMNLAAHQTMIQEINTS